MECADKDTKAFKSTDPLIKTIGAFPQQSTDRAQNCYCCGHSNHTPANCKFKDARCLKCKKIGYIVPACQSPRAEPRPWQQKQADMPQKQADYQRRSTEHIMYSRMKGNHLTNQAAVMEISSSTGLGNSPPTQLM